MRETILLQLVRQAATNSNLNPDRVRVTEELRATVLEFEAAVQSALERLCDEVPCRTDADELMADNGPYLVYLTVSGDQSGVWDGRWDAYFLDSDWYSEARPLLESELSEWVDDSGSGRLQAAIRDAAEETSGRHRKDRLDRFEPNKGVGYYVWSVVPGSNTPTEDAAQGPYALSAAKQTARIKAKGGKNDRVVSSGLHADTISFRIVRRYQAKTGDRLL